MAYFPDLSAYNYSRHAQPGVVHVGWLDGVHRYPEGTVASHLIEKLKNLALKPVELYRGFHICELCPGHVTTVSVEKGDPRYEQAWSKRGTDTRFYRAQEFLSNGEIRVAGNGLIYAAPVLIVHYIQAHGYLPPTEFLYAVEMHRME